MKKFVLVVNDYRDLGHSYYLPFAEFGEFSDDLELLDKDYKKINLIVFTGGSDVTPSYYGDKKHNYSYCNEERDAEESEVFNRARALGIPMTGICRGVQFLNVMCGGKMFQHITNHGCVHDVSTHDNKQFPVVSTHHQLVIPGEGGEVVAWSTIRRSSVYFRGNGESMPPDKEVEAILYRNEKVAGVQWHPEAMSEDSLGFKWTTELTGRLM